MNAIAIAGKMFDRARRAPLLVKAGMLCGVLAGATVGVMLSSPVGMVFGLTLGASVGFVAGKVMDGDEQRAQHRTRELDAIIGVSNGTLGAPPRIAPPPDDERERDLASWVTEWMTPPPPQVG